MELTPVHTLNLTGVLSESKRIIRNSYIHFLALSLFFLPLSFSLIICPALRLSDELFTTDHFHKLQPNHQKSVISHLIYILIAYVLSLSAITTITYSTYHGFFSKPINFIPALKSLIFSFFPLISTAIVAQLLLNLISLIFLIFVGSILMLVQTLGFVIDYHSIYFMWFSVIVLAMLVVIIVYFHVNWSLAFAVVVVESKWGFSPLMRSTYLVKGMKSVSLSLLLYFGIIGGILMWACSDDLHRYSSSWAFVLIMMITSTLFCLHVTVANTVLYTYCKAFHGELEIEGFAYDYINLPSDDDHKVPHVVTVVAA